MPSPRALAGYIVHRVMVDEAYSQRVLSAELDRSGLEPRDKAFATTLSYGTLTWLAFIDSRLASFARKPLNQLDSQVLCHLRVASYQLLFLRDTNPAYAVVHETVGILRNSEHNRFSGLANALLRRVAHSEPHSLELSGLEIKDTNDLATQGSITRWIARELEQAYGLDGAIADLSAYNQPSRLHLRLRTSIDAPQLQTPEVTLSPHPVVKGAVIADGPVRALSSALDSLSALVQDAGAQAAVTLIPTEAKRALDACAGVGTKSLQLLDRCPQVRLTVSDRHAGKIDVAERLIRGAGQADRAEFYVRDLIFDAPPPDEEPFDAILLDAPCSALGTIGRHPEVRWRRMEESIEDLTQLQAQMLKATAARLAPGGHLIYVVCTFSLREGPLQIEKFLENNPNFSIDLPDSALDQLTPDLHESVRYRGGLALRPSLHLSDGFWMTRLKRDS